MALMSMCQKDLDLLLGKDLSEYSNSGMFMENFKIYSVSVELSMNRQDKLLTCLLQCAKKYICTHNPAV